MGGRAPNQNDRYITLRAKMGKCHFMQKNQCFVSFPKLIREIPLSWNSIFEQSSYNKLKIKKKKKFLELELYELEFHANFILFYFLSLITSYSIFYKSSFTLKLDFEKIEFQKRDIFLISLGNGAKCWFFFFFERGICPFSPQNIY